MLAEMHHTKCGIAKTQCTGITLNDSNVGYRKARYPEAEADASDRIESDADFAQLMIDAAIDDQYKIKDGKAVKVLR